jgi:ribosomal protein S15P/S13E
MLLSKLGSSDSTLQSENSSLTMEVDLLKQENAALNDAVSATEKQCSCLEEDIKTLQSSLKSTQSDLHSKKMELESKTKELQSVRDTLSTQRSERDRELSRLEDDLRRSEEQTRSMQIELMERTHCEARLKGELSSADGRSGQLEAENMTLRRRLLDASEGRDRDVSQLQNRVMSLESELRNVMDDLARVRAAGGATDMGGGYGGRGSSYVSQPPVRSSVPSREYYPPPPAPLPSHSHSSAYPDREWSGGASRSSAGGYGGSHQADQTSSSSSLAGYSRQGGGGGGGSDGDMGGRGRSGGSRLSMDSSASSLRSSGERDRGDYDRYGSSVESSTPQQQRQGQPKSLRGALDKDRGGGGGGSLEDDSRESIAIIRHRCALLCVV